MAWDLLLSGGYAGLNVDEVAERAAVAKTTLYRRWPTKDHLAIAVVTRMIPFALVPDTGDISRRACTCTGRRVVPTACRLAWPANLSPRRAAIRTSVT